MFLFRTIRIFKIQQVVLQALSKKVPAGSQRQNMIEAAADALDDIGAGTRKNYIYIYVYIVDKTKFMNIHIHIVSWLAMQPRINWLQIKKRLCVLEAVLFVDNLVCLFDSVLL